MALVRQIFTFPTERPSFMCLSVTYSLDIITRGSWSVTGIFSPHVFKACSHFQQLVLVEKTRLTQQYFPAVQKFVLFNLGLSLLPVGGQMEASQLIAQTIHGASKENPFRCRTSSRLMEPLVLALTQQIPGVGRIKAVALLQKFSSIQQLCNADPAELEPIVGQASAQQIHSFFHRLL
ncbi:Fanconi anemia core complex-associated protein 24 isoform X2 [Nematolebias whitei]|uniref:Fanconi anemia core complex-associated protein 24 isoform X2 n=1 Tax=Nematolebias whitei TaxID=451745 RepID=UPI00189ADEF7|nr:Fanconi anemia core complex-associated protein 24 isoform X2 [Nematolebias whitei]